MMYWWEISKKIQSLKVSFKNYNNIKNSIQKLYKNAELD